MTDIFSSMLHALTLSLGMFWEVAWSLVLGFFIAACVQVLVPKEKLQAALGGSGARSVALATGLGALSSSCSYASASVSRSLFQKGASLTTSLAFLFASTNLVIELGLVLLLLMGWQFMAAEWIGGVVLVIIMSLLVRLTYPARLVEEARQIAGNAHRGHVHEDHGSVSKIQAIGQHFMMDLGMLWKDLLAGFLIAGFLMVFVPQNVWHTLFVTNAPASLQVPLNALIGPLIAVISFVCSIGNVPMAAALWGSGISFGGVLAFLYADLIVLPLLDVYRLYFGWKMAVYIGLIFYATMALTGILMDLAFTGLGLIPDHAQAAVREHGHFAVNYTFWLNLVFAGLAGFLFIKGRKAPPKKPPSCCGGHGH